MTIYDIENQKTIDTMEGIEFDDEIISIECIGENECIDIEVSDDHLFYANDILTKNSFGIPATADSMIVQGVDEDGMIYENELKWKCVKNRLGGQVGKIGKWYHDQKSLRIYDEEELDLWVEEAIRSGDQRNRFEREIQ